MSYSSCSCFCLLDRTIQICVSWFFEHNSLILATGCSTWHLMSKNSEDLRIRIVALHKDGWGIKKFGNSLELSYSTVARVIQRFSKMCFTRTVLARVDQEVESLCCASGAEADFKKQTHECCQHCFRGCRSGRSACQCSDHTPHTQHVSLHGRRPRRKPLLKLAHKKPANSLLKTTCPRALITGTMSCGLMSLR